MPPDPKPGIRIAADASGHGTDVREAGRPELREDDRRLIREAMEAAP